VVAPVLTVRVDWDNDGDFTDTHYWPLLSLSSTYDEITGDVMNVTWQRGGNPDFGTATPGDATITVDNSRGTYTPENTASLYYGKLLPGRPVWITAVHSATTYGIFAGFIRRIVPHPETKTAELFCEDPLARYDNADVAVPMSTSRSFRDFRTAILDAIGESAARRDLAIEDDVIPVSSADQGSALELLGKLNEATATRHFVKPGTAAASWYQYTTRNRHYKLSSAADSTVAGTDPAAMAGYEVTADTVLNSQRVTATPLLLGETETLWEHPNLPFTVPASTSWVVLPGRPRRKVTTSTSDVFVTFDNFVVNAAIAYVASGAPTVTLTHYGKTAKIDITAGGSEAVFTELSITGQLAQPANELVALFEDTTSRTTYGRHAQELSTEWLSGTSLAQGLADHLVWRFKDLRKRPEIEIRNKFPLALERELFDTISLSLSALSITSRRFEIVGIRGSVAPGGEWSIAWQLQETPEQPTLTNFFTLDSSLLDGTHVLGR
jgi:hypothetical protein